MRNFGRLLPKGAVVLRGGNGYSRGVGGESGTSSIELLAPDSEFTQEQPNSFSSIWKPAWHPSWRTGALACATSTVVVLFINIGLVIYATKNPRYGMDQDNIIGTFYSGSCDKSRTIGLWLHLGINALSALLFSGSNYTQQCLAAPTRSEVDAAHVERRWMDIGVPSLRNLFRIKPERAFLWIVIGITSIPLHLLYNSAVYTSLVANDFLVTVVTQDYFEPGAYSNITEALIRNSYPDSLIAHFTKEFSPVLEEYNNSTRSYENLTPAECTKLYNTNFIYNHSNLFLITNRNSNTGHNNTLLDVVRIYTEEASSSCWMCAYDQVQRGPSDTDYLRPAFSCRPSDLTSNVTTRLPWLIKLGTGEEVEIGGCKSERTVEKCKVRLSLGIMIAVICCTLFKACCMITAVVRSREPTLVTLGDALDSFLKIPDPTTIGMCFADRRFIKREWRRGCTVGPRQWKQRGVQRWWTSVGKMRWITCNFFSSTTIVVATVLLWLGMQNDGVVWSTDLKSMWARGFGDVNNVSQFTIPSRGMTRAALLSNLPQIILSFLYLTYNSLFTCMLLGHEWSLFSHRHRTLRVTSPHPGQRSTYWLQIPYTYAIPLMTLSCVLHWLLSQSSFLAVTEILDPLGKKNATIISAVGYSCIAIIFLLTLGILALVTAAGIGYKQFAAEITTVGSCSAAISAACHPAGANSEETTGKKVRWGDVGTEPNLGVRHLTFSSEKGVRKPVLGEVYAGTGERECDCL
ncbi:hypothetical protein B9Z19DRAFT_1131133 [Tuber borchii]|uniref:DUF6536 domain-containing protein n=1 Tax=Tuber borchii TaxID=42251 RepID=A0A2T6ZJ74_TUBBO|nr:hypothetical protein B9Z19DRAFT_1131133 [Tuber borchii]